MITVDFLTELLGWSTVINIAVLMFASLALIVARGMMVSIHGKMFGLDEKDLSLAYFNYLANYKILIFVFNLVPYIALRLMG